MATLLADGPRRTLTLPAAAAGELMSPNPVSIRRSATVREALGVLLDHGFAAAPVIDEAGHPVGVVSRGDILFHDREIAVHLQREPEYYREAEMHGDRNEHLPGGFQVERPDATTVGEIMTPAVFTVTADTPAEQVIRDMVRLHVHRVFVRETDGCLVGVISTLDVLKRMLMEG